MTPIAGAKAIISSQFSIKFPIINISRKLLTSKHLVVSSKTWQQPSLSLSSHNTLTLLLYFEPYDNICKGCNLNVLWVDFRGVSNGVRLELGHVPFVKLLSLIAIVSNKETIETNLLAGARDIWNMFISIQHSALTTRTVSSFYLLPSSALLQRKFG